MWGLEDTKATEVAYAWLPARRRDAALLLVWRNCVVEPLEKEEVVRSLRMVTIQVMSGDAMNLLAPLYRSLPLMAAQKAFFPASIFRRWPICWMPSTSRGSIT